MNRTFSWNAMRFRYDSVTDSFLMPRNITIYADFRRKVKPKGLLEKNQLEPDKDEKAAKGALEIVGRDDFDQVRADVAANDSGRNEGCRGTPFNVLAAMVFPGSHDRRGDDDRQ